MWKCDDSLGMTKNDFSFSLRSAFDQQKFCLGSDMNVDNFKQRNRDLSKQQNVTSCEKIVDS